MTGGPANSTIGRSAQTPRRRFSWLQDPRLVTHLPTVAAVAIFAGAFLRYRQRWFIPGFSDYLLWVHATVTSGTAIAPNQYRPLMPWVARLLSEGLSLTLPHAILLLDAGLLALAVTVLHRALAERGAAPLLVVAALGFGYWFAKLDHWSPETMLLVALVAVAARELSRPATRWGVVVLVAVLMLGARTDFAATLAVTVIAVGAVRRSWPIAALGSSLLAVAAAATAFWILVLPPGALRHSAHPNPLQPDARIVGLRPDLLRAGAARPAAAAGA